ncbi:MAG: hypothetical protein M3306_17710 [Actinomycetota bacterium]|nr:hypothetical protein [Actinomycetota bacterium]
MKKPKRQAPTESAPPRREDFANWSGYQGALAASEAPDDFERLLEMPQTLDDWIDHEEASARRWFATQPYADGPPLEAYLSRARERAHRNYYDTTKDPTHD